MEANEPNNPDADESNMNGRPEGLSKPTGPQAIENPEMSDEITLPEDGSENRDKEKKLTEKGPKGEPPYVE